MQYFIQEIEVAYHTYSKFSTSKRQPNMSMNDFVIQLENLNYKMDSHDMKLPEKLLAFKLLDWVSVSENQRQMCLTLASDILYNRMMA